MQTFTFDDVKEFIMAQPDDAPVDMGHCLSGKCGCIMAQFFNSKGVNFLSVSYHGHAAYWVDDTPIAEINDPDSVAQLVDTALSKPVHTFGQVKELI
jgi:hypothetical protein